MSLVSRSPLQAGGKGYSINLPLSKVKRTLAVALFALIAVGAVLVAYHVCSGYHHALCKRRMTLSKILTDIALPGSILAALGVAAYFNYQGERLPKLGGGGVDYFTGDAGPMLCDGLPPEYQND